MKPEHDHGACIAKCANCGVDRWCGYGPCSRCGELTPCPAAAAATRQCPHGFHHPGVGYSVPHSCDGCWCEGEHDRSEFGWANDTSPGEQVK